MTLWRCLMASTPLLWALPSGALDEKVRDVKIQAPAVVPASNALAPLSVAPSVVVPVGEPREFAEPPSLPAVSVAPEAAPSSAEPASESLVESGRLEFDRVAREELRTRYSDVPASYRRDLARRGAPKVEIIKVLSREGSSSVVYEAELNGRRIAVKTYTEASSGGWADDLAYFEKEVRMAESLSRILGPRGMAPKSYGEVDVGEGGNPSFGMDIIVGKDPDRLTPAQARRLITRKSIRQAAEGMRLLAAAGLGGGDSPQPMILTEAQTVNGVPRRAGDVVFMDPGGLTEGRKSWESPEQKAEALAFWRLFADGLGTSHLREALDDIPITLEQAEEIHQRAQRLVRSILSPKAPKKGNPGG